MEKNIKIKNVYAREVLDSRGNPTIEVEITLTDDSIGSFIVPSGASCGQYEAYELRDNDLSFYNGLSVNKAINNVNTIIKHNLINKDPFKQKEIDELLIKLDGTSNKHNLGANAILGVSMAVLKACANSKKMPLFKYINDTTSFKIPFPMLNIINGGKHANNNLDIQEFMIVPINCHSFKEGIRKSSEVYHKLKDVLKENNKTSFGIGDEGGYAPLLETDEEAIKMIIQAIQKANYTPGYDFLIALDIAASEWYIKEKDIYFLPKQKIYKSKEELIDYYEYLTNYYPICSIEDALADVDIQGWKVLTHKLDQKILLVGDDLFVTNPNRLKLGIKENIANAILIKPNQIGTFTETMKTINLAKKNNYTVIISHRSGDSEDTTISDLAVATSAKYIKSGALSRSERVSKYNQLIRIEEKIKRDF